MRKQISLPDQDTWSGIVKDYYTFLETLIGDMEKRGTFEIDWPMEVGYKDLKYKVVFNIKKDEK